MIHDAKECLREIEEHPCGLDQIVECPVPRKLWLGWKCLQCDKKWTMRLSVFHASSSLVRKKLRGLKVMKQDPFAVGQGREEE
jgi:hypothetical protein